MPDQDNAEAKAAQAAEALSVEGIPVTARAVRARSGVRMAVAAEAARAWNEAQAQATEVPEMPPAVEARFAAAWREAVLAARAEFAQSQAGWQGRLNAVDAERRALAEDVEKAEAERDQAQAETAGVREEAAEAAAAAAQALTEQRSRADRAEARAEAVEGERNRLIAERDRLQAECDNLRTAISEQPNRAKEK